MPFSERNFLFQQYTLKRVSKINDENTNFLSIQMPAERERKSKMLFEEKNF